LEVLHELGRSSYFQSCNRFTSRHKQNTVTVTTCTFLEGFLTTSVQKYILVFDVLLNCCSWSQLASDLFLSLFGSGRVMFTSVVGGEIIMMKSLQCRLYLQEKTKSYDHFLDVLRQLGPNSRTGLLS